MAHQGLILEETLELDDESAFLPVQRRLMQFVRARFASMRGNYSVSKLIGDASARQYFRLVRDDGHSFILAAYPEPFDQGDFAYKQVYDLFLDIGVPVPAIYEIDGDLGIVLQEDLGNETVHRHLVKAGPSERKRLFDEAIRFIAILQAEGTASIGPGHVAYEQCFDEEKLRWELGFFEKHYLRNYRQQDVSVGEGLIEEFDRLAAELAGFPRVLCHRDFHVRNLMLRGSQLFVIDFQDARRGPEAYDLVSLIKDSIDLPPEETELSIRLFRERTGSRLSQEEFHRQFHLMCLQRLLKAIGTYGYQIFVRENFIYEQYIPGSLRRVIESLWKIHEFPAIRSVIETELRQ